ncbi:MAG: hypothetical protein FJ091_15515 [Deltaproteobacteria bacterium]|nr:hypothetical protein [Deltaproteobacteria bacterium]
MRRVTERTSRKKSAREALAFVRKHGVVLMSARGDVPSLAAWIAGEPIRGSWWAHPRAHEIYAIECALAESPDVVFCKLVAGKRTLVHRRLWPALARVSDRFAAKALARVVEQHTERGNHAAREIALEEWLPAAARAASRKLTPEAALAQLAACGVRG